MTTAAQTSLISKLTDVMNAIGRIPKNGRNTFHNYDYATEADIVEAIRSELANRNVFLIPGIDGHERVGVGEKGEVVTLLRMSFTFKDGDTQEEITRPWMGSGSDKLDKGLYKAMTGGEKYFLLKTFLIPTGDDPERDEHTHPQAQENRHEHDTRKAQQQRQPPPAARPGEVRVVDIRAAKKGTSNKGPWTLWIVKLSDNRELKTFDDKLANAATAAQRNKHAVDITVDGENLTKLEPVFRVEREPVAP